MKKVIRQAQVIRVRVPQLIVSIAINLTIYGGFPRPPSLLANTKPFLIVIVVGS